MRQQAAAKSNAFRGAGNKKKKNLLAHIFVLSSSPRVSPWRDRRRYRENRGRTVGVRFQAGTGKLGLVEAGLY